VSVRSLRRGSIAASRVSAPATVTVLTLPGTSGNYASTPDSAAVSVTEDFDIRVKISLADWTPANRFFFLSKWRFLSNQRSYRFGLEATNGIPLWVLTSNGATDGTGILANTQANGLGSDVPTGFANGTAHWVRVTHDRTGASVSTSFYTSDDYNPATETGTWNQLGASQTWPSGFAVTNTVADLEIGATNATANDTASTIYYAELRSAVNGTIVAKYDPSGVTKLGTRNPATLVASTGETWTMNGTGWDWSTA
jgi:hypothetical protein